MRQFYLIVLALALIGVALLLANQRLSGQPSQSTDLPEIVLGNLPIGYCPTQAEVYHTSRINLTTRLPVRDCQRIPLRTLELSETETVVVKLPRALAFAVNYSQEIDRYAIGIRVGDVNGDNVIDASDEELVLSDLFTESANGDADTSGTVTADDLALVRINQAVGVNRPDNKPWALQ